MEDRKRTRVDLIISQKKEICDFKEQNPNLPIRAIVEHFQRKWGITLGRSTVSEIITNSQRWKALPEFSANKHRIRSGKHVHLENALFVWLNDAVANNTAVSDEALRQQGRRFGELLTATNHGEFTYSNGWLSGFKRRFGIKTTRLEGGSTWLLDTLYISAEQVNLDVQKYGLEDVYVLVPVTLLYDYVPTGRYNCRQQTSGLVTVLLCTNATGTDKIHPFVVSRKRDGEIPSENQDVESGHLCCIQDASNTMTAMLFMQWLRRMEKYISTLKNRKVLLIIGPESYNASMHLHPRHIKVRKLTKKTRPLLQNVVESISILFKAAYRGLQVDLVGGLIKTAKSSKIGLKTALRLVGESWSHLPGEVIHSCWHTSHLDMPQHDCHSPKAPLGLFRTAELLSIQKLSTLLCQSESFVMSSTDYINVEGEHDAEHPLEDQDIISLVTCFDYVEPCTTHGSSCLQIAESDMIVPSNLVVPSYPSEVSKVLRTKSSPTLKDGLNAIQTVIRYMEVNGIHEHLQSARVIRKHLESISEERKCHIIL